MEKKPRIPTTRSHRVIDQCLEFGRRFRLEIRVTTTESTQQPDDCFSNWLRDDNSVSIDWSNFGIRHDA